MTRGRGRVGLFNSGITSNIFTKVAVGLKIYLFIYFVKHKKIYNEYPQRILSPYKSNLTYHLIGKELKIEKF